MSEVRLKTPPKLPPLVSPEMFCTIARRYYLAEQTDVHDFFLELKAFYEQGQENATS